MPEQISNIVVCGYLNILGSYSENSAIDWDIDQLFFLCS